MRVISRSARQTLKIGVAIGRSLKKGDIICLSGDLGSGKTVLAKGIAEGLGVDSNDVVSPTFILMRQYEGRLPLYHFDLYRLQDPAGVTDLGHEEYFFGCGVCVIEWAERLGRFFPDACIKAELEITAPGRRTIHITANGSRYKGVLKSIDENTCS